MKFVIAGCGIGGLTLAHAITQSGHGVILLERSPHLKPVGAGISLQPNVLQALKRLELDAPISAAGWKASRVRVISDKGKEFSDFDFSNYEEHFGCLPHTIYRGDLIRVLHEELDLEKTTILLDEPLESFEDSQDGVVARTNRQSIECDGLIGADGIHSAVRRQLWGEATPIFAGYTCWRGIVDDPALVSQIDTMTEVWAKGSRFGFMRCNAKQVYWFATASQKERSDHLDASAEWQSRFQSWINPVAKLIESTPPESIVHNDIVDLEPIFPWGRGRVSLVGDAAHAMTPNFGQGGAQAIEDAVILGRAIKRIDGPEQIDSAFRSFETFRNERTTKLVRGSRQFGKIGQGGNWIARFVRNYVMPKLPKSFVDKQLFWQCDFESHAREF